MSVHLIVPGILVAVLLYIMLEGYTGFLSMRRLADTSEVIAGEMPSVSIIIPAMNEEENIAEALGSVLALDYPKLEIVVINDRSTDSTGTIIDQLAGNDLRVKVVHVEELPSGWLGKNHALWLGARRSAGDLLLFTDGDVVMEKTTLRRAVNYLSANSLDHLAMFFDPLVPGGMLNMLIIDFGLSFLSFMKPWKASDPQSRFYVGIGAFNLVRKKAYESIGTHRALSLHPVDDVELGRQIKKNGFRQDCLIGSGFISVKWYSSVMEMVRGLEKNIFPFCNFSIFRVVLLSLFLFFMRIWPMAAIFVYSGAVQLVYGLMILLVVLMVLISIRQNKGVPLRSVLFSPLSPFLTLYIVWRATLLTLVRGGIVWRTTFYPLDELKRAFRQYK